MQKHSCFVNNDCNFFIFILFSEKSTKVPWRAILTSVPVWALVIAHFGHIWGFYTLLFQLPTYFRTVLGLELKKVSKKKLTPFLF